MLLVLAGCAPSDPRTTPYKTSELPVIEGYMSAVPAGHTDYTNQSLTEVFVQLTHFYEGGAEREGIFKFEGPITVAMSGKTANQYDDFLDLVLTQIRQNTNIDITRASGQASIIVRFIPDQEILSAIGVQCMLLPGQPTWPQFLANPGQYAGAQVGVDEFSSGITVFIPEALEPYKIRQCLLEEIVQALGTANDLFGLGPTIFNDDQAHTWPTALDYLMLRVLYDPSMKRGTGLDQTRRAAQSILARLNPRGERPDAEALQHPRLLDFTEWRKKLHSLNDDGKDIAKQIDLAHDLYEDAQARAPDSAFSCTALSVLASKLAETEDRNAKATFTQAIALCARVHGNLDVRLSQLRMRRAAHELRLGSPTSASNLRHSVIEDFAAHGQDENLTAALVLATAGALKMEDKAQALGLALELREWMAYSFGADHAMTQKLQP